MVLMGGSGLSNNCGGERTDMKHLDLHGYWNWRRGVTEPMLGTVFEFAQARDSGSKRDRIKAQTRWQVTAIRASTRDHALPADSWCDLVLVTAKGRPRKRTVAISAEGIAQMLESGQIVVV